MRCTPPSFLGGSGLLLGTQGCRPRLALGAPGDDLGRVHRALLALLLPLLACTGGCATPNARRGALQELCEGVIQGFDGEVGLYVRHLGTGETAAVRADELFPTASLIKVPILCATFDALERGALTYHGKLSYSKDRLYPGEDLLGSFRDGEPIDVAKLCLLMITTSDNTASLWLQEACGTGTTINAWLDAHGFRRTRVNSRTPGREVDRERFGWGETTPREIAELVALIRQRRAVSPEADDEMHRILTRTFWDGEALAGIPPEVQTMSKQGAVNASRSEVCLVHAPSGDYVFSILTKEQKDTSWEFDNAGFALIRALSQALYQHFEGTAVAMPSRSYW
jgi:beta-lactamase class A